MLTRSPWADQGADPVAAARAGLSLGLDFSRLRQAGAEADARTQLGYAELSQRASDAAANRSQAAATAGAQLARAQAEDALNAGFRDRTVATEEARTGLMQSKFNLPPKGKVENAGGGLYLVNPDNTIKELIPRAGSNNFLQSQWSALAREHQHIQDQLADPYKLGKDALRARLSEVQKSLGDIESKLKSSGVSVFQSSPDAVADPSIPDASSFMSPGASLSAPIDILGGLTRSTEPSAGKWKVTEVK